MRKNIKDVGRARHWLRLRDRIRKSRNGPERLNLLRRFGDEIRNLMPMVVKASTVEKDDITRAHEVATAHGVVIGAWLQLDPMNPDWPGRDRMFVMRREDLINTCSVLSTLGFFPPEQVAYLVEQVDLEGSAAVVPGLESPGYPAEEILAKLWDSAVESGRSKRRWREQMSGDPDWVDPAWLESPAVWRSCAIFDVSDPVTEQCRLLPAKAGDRPAGLVALVKVARADAHRLAELWTESGWESVVVNRNDSLSLYDVLMHADMGKPLAVMLAIGAMASQSHVSRTVIRRRESGLLGELSDDKFNEVMGEFLGF